MRLEVGKVYVDRRGKLITIIRRSGDGIFPYKSLMGSFKKSGRWAVRNTSMFDLIEEASTLHQVIYGSTT